MSPPLSPETRRRLERLFAPRRREEAERLLRDDCGNNLPFCGGLDSAGLERVRFAALKVSGGRLDKLAEAVRLAQIDWRDLLMNAGFGFDERAHESWEP